jgi:hypothetical protein
MMMDGLVSQKAVKLSQDGFFSMELVGITK